MVALLRAPAVCARMGKGRATLHEDVQRGVLSPPVKLGSRWAAWPEHEIDQILRARIAGWSDDQLRNLVKRLVAERKSIAPAGIEHEQRAAP